MEGYTPRPSPEGGEAGQRFLKVATWKCRVWIREREGRPEQVSTRGQDKTRQEAAANAEVPLGVVSKHAQGTRRSPVAQIEHIAPD